jgi:hypothetical protein
VDACNAALYRASSACISAGEKLKYGPYWTVANATRRADYVTGRQGQ